MNKKSEINIRHLDQEIQRVKSILTEEEFSALNHEIPMTQLLYNSILDKIMLIIPSADSLLFHILQNPEYTDFMITYAEITESL